VENERIEMREGRKEMFVADRRMHDRLKLGLELRAGNKKVVLKHLLRWRKIGFTGFWGIACTMQHCQWNLLAKVEVHFRL
jgi:hypothetical protein